MNNFRHASIHYRAFLYSQNNFFPEVLIIKN
jgi:hypothetical protein